MTAAPGGGLPSGVLSLPGWWQLRESWSGMAILFVVTNARPLASLPSGLVVLWCQCHGRAQCTGPVLSGTLLIRSGNLRPRETE